MIAIPKLTRIIDQIPLVFYVIIALFIANINDFEFYKLTADLDFYHSYVVAIFKNLGIPISDLSINICGNACYRSLNDWNWIPSPFYSILFLLPITLLGSKFVFALQGFFIGSIYFYLVSRLARRYLFLPKEYSIYLLWSLLLVVNPTIVHNLLGSSPMTIFTIFVLIGLTCNSLLARYFFFCLALLMRSSSISFLFAYVLTLLLHRPPRFKVHMVYLFILTSIYFLCYHFFYSGYPLSFPSTLYLAEASGYSNWQEYVSSFLVKSMGVDTVIGNNISISELFQSIFSYGFEGLNILIQNFFVKFSVFLGFQYDGITMGGQSGLLGPVRIWKTILFWGLMLPGFYNIVASLMVPNRLLKSNIKSLFYFSLISIIVSSLLIANSRYVIPVIPIILYSGFDFWSLNRLSRKEVIGNL